MTKEFNCYTHLAKNLPKKFLILTQKNHFSNRKNRFSTQRKNFLYSPPKNQKNFHIRFKEPFTWYTQLAHPKKKILPKMFFILIQKKNDFQTKKIFTPTWKNRFSTQRKHLFIYPPKNQFFKRKSSSHPFQRNVHLVQSHGPPKKENSTQNVFYNYPKKQFSKRKNFSHPLERTDFLPKENIYLFAPQKTNFSNEKVFHARFKETFTWYNHMTHPKKENSTPKISYT